MSIATTLVLPTARSRHNRAAPARYTLICATAATLLTALTLAFDVVRANGVNALELVMLALFALAFTWIAMSFWTATLGFIRLLRYGSGTGDTPAVTLTTRTAIVMPVHREEPARFCAGLEAVWRSLQRTGQAGSFDIFILSDTPDAAAGAEEERHWAALCVRTGGAGRIHYRRRTQNAGRKAGNIADFCERWGAHYDHMLVLDADSVMSGDTIVRLAQMMQNDPRAGIIQTVPMPANRSTLFARAQQFASRLYGPVVAAGTACWHGADSNFWGHNAIIRIPAFMTCCRLPQLPGEAPLGGEILSHDFVEAALIRRGGWTVQLVPEIEGSYEEMPANVIDYAARDRRWCQGNLQHARLVPAQGLHPLNRCHMASGVMAYAASPLWLALLLLGMADVSLQALSEHAYFLPGYNLFPNWPQSRTQEIGALLALTATVLLAPKLYGLGFALADRSRRDAFGGAVALVRSAAAELLFSLLLAPVTMYCHSIFIARILSGSSVGWTAQPRDDRGIGWAEATRRFTTPTLLGLAWSAALLAIAPAYLAWFLPVLAGLTLSIPLAVLTSRRSLGLAAAGVGLFATPEETARYKTVLGDLDEAGDASSTPVNRRDIARLHALQPVALPQPMPEQSLVPFWRARSRDAAPRGRSPVQVSA